MNMPTTLVQEVAEEAQKQLRIQYSKKIKEMVLKMDPTLKDDDFYITFVDEGEKDVPTL
jgi:hypothetical protein